MELKVGGVCKALIAVCTLKGSLARMGALMLLSDRQQKKKTVKRKTTVFNTHTRLEICTSLFISAELTCFRFDVWEKDLEQVEQT